MFIIPRFYELAVSVYRPEATHLLWLRVIICFLGFCIFLWRIKLLSLLLYFRKKHEILCLMKGIAV